MATLLRTRLVKCPSCGANAPYEPGTTALTCEYCKTRFSVESRGKRDKPTQSTPARDDAPPLPVARPHVNPAVYMTPFLVMAIGTGSSLLISRAAEDAATDRVSAALAGVSSTLAGVTGDSDLGELGKLEEYRACLDLHAPRAHDSQERYLSWCDREKGPTGRERHISHGLYTLHDVEACQEKIAKVATQPPARPELDAAASAFIAAVVAAAPDVASASRYYDHGDYKDDDAARGKELHPALLSHYAAIGDAAADLDRALIVAEDELDARLLARAESEQRELAALTLRPAITARALRRLAREMDPVSLESLDLDRYAPLVERLSGEIEAMEAHPTMGETTSPRYTNSLESALKNAKELRRRADGGRNYKRSEKRHLRTGSGWMVDGSAPKLLRDLDTVIDARPDAIRRTWGA